MAKKKGAELSEEAKEKRREKDRRNTAKRRAAESPEDRAARLARKSANESKRFKSLTPEQRAASLARRDRIPENRPARLARKREVERQRLRDETPEHREVRLKKKRKSTQARKEAILKRHRDGFAKESADESDEDEYRDDTSEKDGYKASPIEISDEDDYRDLASEGDEDEDSPWQSTEGEDSESSSENGSVHPSDDHGSSELPDRGFDSELSDRDDDRPHQVSDFALSAQDSGYVESGKDDGSDRRGSDTLSTSNVKVIRKIMSRIGDKQAMKTMTLGAESAESALRALATSFSALSHHECALRRKQSEFTLYKKALEDLAALSTSMPPGMKPTGIVAIMAVVDAWAARMRQEGRYEVLVVNFQQKDCAIISAVEARPSTADEPLQLAFRRVTHADDSTHWEGYATVIDKDDVSHDGMLERPTEFLETYDPRLNQGSMPLGHDCSTRSCSRKEDEHCYNESEHTVAQ